MYHLVKTLGGLPGEQQKTVIVRIHRGSEKTVTDNLQWKQWNAQEGNVPRRDKIIFSSESLDRTKLEMRRFLERWKR